MKGLQENSELLLGSLVTQGLTDGQRLAAGQLELDFRGTLEVTAKIINVSIGECKAGSKVDGCSL